MCNNKTRVNNDLNNGFTGQVIYYITITIEYKLYYLFKEYVQFLNRLYDITWFGAVYA